MVRRLSGPQDWAFYPQTNDDLAAVGIMLDDCEIENGPMMVMPGSHQGPVYDHHGPDGRFCGAIDPAQCDLDFSRAVPCLGKAGSVTVHHVRAVHGYQFLRYKGAVAAVPISSSRCLAAARLRGRHREIRRIAARRQSDPGAASGTGPCSATLAAGRAPRLDLRESARHRPAVF